MDYKKLLDKAEWGELSQKEISKVAKELENRFSEIDKYTLIHILGEAGTSASQYQKLVEKYLYCPENPMLSQCALITLSDWGKTSEYLDHILQFIRGVEWDEGGQCRIIAISRSGEFLRDSNNTQLLNELIKIVEDPEETENFHNTAYSALSRAMGFEWPEIIHKKITQDVLNLAKERYLKEN